MLRLKDNFRPNAPISQVPASWFNAVASFLNNLIGGYGVKINKNGAFPIISINPDVLSEQSKYKPTTEHTELETPSENQDFASKGHVYDEANVPTDNQVITTDKTVSADGRVISDTVKARSFVIYTNK